MAGNVIQFSLGLAAGGFVQEMARARGAFSGLVSSGLKVPVIGTAIGGLIASVSSFGAVVENTFAQIEKGSELNKLSKRTGESVGELFRLQKGFKAAGLGAEGLSPMLFQMQKALGGFNEMGEPTKDIFKGIGLEVEALKGMKPSEAFEKITRALAGLNTSEASTAAGKIFGRAGAQDALQLARSGEDVAHAMADAGEQAALFGRNAASFEKLEMGIGRLKGRFNTLFAGIAEGAAPGLQALVDMLNKIDLSGLGKRIGDIFLAVTTAAKVGQLTELLRLGLSAAFESAMTILVNRVRILGSALPSLMVAGMAQAIAIQAGMMQGVLSKLGIKGGPLADIQKGFAGVSADIGGPALKALLTGGFEGIFDGPAAKEFKDAMEKFAEIGRAHGKGIAGGVAALAGGDAEAKVKTAKQQQDANALERIGGQFFRGVALAQGLDYQRQTAKNTGLMYTDLKEFLKRNPRRNFSVENE